MKTSEILKAAREVIADPSKWIKEDFSDERNGVMCYCALGAVAKVTGVPEYAVVHSKANEALKQAVIGWFIEKRIHTLRNTFAVFNDANDHTDVLVAFDRAIMMQEANGD